MNKSAYTFLGWIVWQLGSRVAKYQMGKNRAKLGAVGVIALVLAGGVLAAKSSGD
jgi:uncharacterized membrane protein